MRVTHRGAIRSALVALVLAACVRMTPFDRYMAQGQWDEAAREFSADSSLLHDEHALYRAGVLFGTPGRATFDAARARELLTTLLTRFPHTQYRDDAASRLALLDEILRSRRSTEARERELESRIADLTRQSRDLKARLDSSAVAGDSLRASVARLEAERRDRDDQLKALKQELQKLKEIDLKPRRPPS